MSSHTPLCFGKCMPRPSLNRCAGWFSGTVSFRHSEHVTDGEGRTVEETCIFTWSPPGWKAGNTKIESSGAKCVAWSEGPREAVGGAPWVVAVGAWWAGKCPEKPSFAQRCGSMRDVQMSEGRGGGGHRCVEAGECPYRVTG